MTDNTTYIKLITYKIYEEDKPSNPSPTPKQIY